MKKKEQKQNKLAIIIATKSIMDLFFLSYCSLYLLSIIIITIISIHASLFFFDCVLTCIVYAKCKQVCSFSNCRCEEIAGT